MMKTRTNLIVALFALCFTGTVSDAYAWGWHKRKSVKNDSVVTSESKYDELYGAQNETYIEGWEKKISNILIYKRLCKI